MFERFTDRARRVLVLAQEEARLLGHGFIGTEHVLLGLIGEGDGIAAQALESMDISLQAVRKKVTETVGMAGSSPSGQRPFTPRAKKVLELSLREALELGHSHIGTEHMLLGLVREGEGVAAQVLVSLGADLGRVRQQVIRLTAAHGPERQGGQPPGGSGGRQAGLADHVTAAPPFGFPAPSADPPDCPRCGASLAEHARHRSLDVPAVTSDELTQQFVVVYCEACGQALAFKPSSAA